jgi:hypothetical protein
MYTYRTNIALVSYDSNVSLHVTDTTYTVLLDILVRTVMK